ncbi:DUF4271 domain-containing protein [Portibacter marinus]|uniref:DUF4271 domain-containing protein n=1 Tax=Portibacter marinus TaxID=2898660 RepID=UPI001F277F96|nr:DUF4271 domain-containing protein [Portibacter marinus]
MKQLRVCSLVVIMLLLVRVGYSQTENPFDIQNRKEVVVDSTPTPDSSSAIMEIVQDTVEKSFVEQRQQMLIDENPFNVSHIPIKSKDKKRQPIPESGDSQIEEITEAVSEQIIANTPLQTNKFLFWFFLLQLLLITSILGINREFIKKINRSISNDNFAKLVSRDYNAGYDALFFILYILFILSLGIYLYLAIRHFYEISGFGKFVLILISVLGIYVFRHFFLGFMSFVFPFRKTISYYNFMIILFNCFLGLLLIPVNVLLAYAPEFFATMALYTGMFFIVISYLLRLLRGSLQAYTLVRKHAFHFFLYLCTCEIAPIFILVKFLSNSFSI